MKLKNKIVVIFAIFIIIALSGCLNIEHATEINEYIEDKKIPINITLSGQPSESVIVFKYEIIASKDNPAGGAKNEIKEFEVTIDTENDKIAEKEFSKTEYIDFSNIEYTRPGLYTYIIKEVSTSSKKDFPVSSNEYKVKMIVKKVDDELVAELYKYTYDVKNDTKDEKIDFSHEQMTYLKFEMFLTGNRANKNEYFKLTVSIFGKPGNVYDIIGQDETITYNGVKISTMKRFGVTEEGYQFNIYLKHGQTVYIGTLDKDGEIYYQIPVGTYVSIVENDARKYQTFINEKEGKIIRNFYLTKDAEKNTIKVVNHADYDVAITGVIINILPYAILIIIVIILLIIVIHKKIKDKKNDEDD